MGSSTKNFYNDAFARQGYGDDVAEVQRLWAAGDREPRRHVCRSRSASAPTSSGHPSRSGTGWSSTSAAGSPRCGSASTAPSTRRSPTSRRSVASPPTPAPGRHERPTTPDRAPARPLDRTTSTTPLGTATAPPQSGRRSDLAQDGLHPVRVQLRGRDPARSRWAHLRADPRRQGPSGVAGLHLREGPAPRPLPERSRRAGAQSAAPSRRRHLRGGRLGHRRRARWPRASARCATSTAATRSCTTAAAGKGTTCAGPTARRCTRGSAGCTAAAPWPRRRAARSG